MSKAMCPCGKPLHYSDAEIQRKVQKLVDEQGELVTVTVGTRRWRVPRHYIALHGLKAEELPTLGFLELKSEIGPELLASQLVPSTVVVLIGTHRPEAALTAWVQAVEKGGVAFLMAEINTALALRVNEQGQMFDDQNHRIAVHEYLGEV